MPRVEEIGFGRYTELKQIHYQAFIRLFLSVHKSIVRKPSNGWIDKTIFMLDLTSGCGYHPKTNEPGSPVIFLNELQQSGIPYAAHFIEQNEPSFNLLCTSVGSRGKCYWGDHRKIAGEILKSEYRSPSGLKRLGYLYYDPSGDGQSLDFLVDLSRCSEARNIDFLIYLAVNNATKRAGRDRIESYMKRMDKKHWLIRKPFGCEQWSFLVGTNWVDFPQYERAQFFSTDKEPGKSFLERVNHTRVELAQLQQSKQLPLFKET